MSSINMLVSELAHSVQQADSVPVRRALKLGIIHARNEMIRRGQDTNKTTDKVLQQRFKLSLIDVPDGDLVITKGMNLGNIKRTLNKVPRATRINHGAPFHSVRTIGLINNTEIPFIKEASNQFYKHLPGMNNTPGYDLINEYIYTGGGYSNRFATLGYIIIESVFEYPHLIQTETSDGLLDLDNISDNDEWFLPEDMVNGVKKLTLETFNPQVYRQTNEIPTPNLVK